MTVWLAAVLAVVFLAGGALFMLLGSKPEKRLWKITGIALLVACAMCVLYLAATWLLLGSIK